MCQKYKRLSKYCPIPNTWTNAHVSTSHTHTHVYVRFLTFFQSIQNPYNFIFDVQWREKGELFVLQRFLGCGNRGTAYKNSFPNYGIISLGAVSLTRK